MRLRAHRRRRGSTLAGASQGNRRSRAAGTALLVLTVAVTGHPVPANLLLHNEKSGLAYTRGTNAEVVRIGYSEDESRSTSFRPATLADLFAVGDLPILLGRAAGSVGLRQRRDGYARFRFLSATRYLLSISPMELPMREDHELPQDRGAGHGETVNRVDDAPATQADGTSADLRTDVPAHLSATSHPADAEEFGLSDEEIAIYRRRVANGLYNTPEVADEVARRMLRRGDI